jgi:minor extracellular serine protease Vpr
VSGAAALLKQARPGLSEAEYRSLLVNSADALAGAGVQAAGAGRLNAANAAMSTLAAAPVSVSFGAGGATVEISREIRLKNLGGTADNYTLSLESADAVKPELSTVAMSLDAGASAAVTLTFRGADLAAGTYGGYVVVRGETSPVAARVPYFYGVRGTAAAKIAVPETPYNRQAGTTIEIPFRVLDAGGLPLSTVTPEVVAAAGDGSVVSVERAPELYPDLWVAKVKLGPIPGVVNLFQFKAGDVLYQWGITSTAPGN